MGPIDRLLLELKDVKDPYRFLASHVTGKPVSSVTQEERFRFKEAFYALFHHRGPDIFKNCLEDLRELDKLPEVHEFLRERARKENNRG